MVKYPRSKQAIALLLALLMVVFVLGLAACGNKDPKKESPTDPAPSLVGQDSKSEGSEPETEPTEAETTDPLEKEDYSHLSPLEKSFMTILSQYSKELPTVSPGKIATVPEQKEFLLEMTRLADKRASSKELLDLYFQGIEALSPNAADDFTAYAMKGVLDNCLAEQWLYDEYFEDDDFAMSFYDAVEEYNYDYFKLNLNAEKIKDEKIRNLILDAHDQGYYIYSSEGFVFPLVDYRLFSKYRSNNTPIMAAIIEDLAMDVIEAEGDDGALLIDWKTIAAKAYGIEKVLVNDEFMEHNVYSPYLIYMLETKMIWLFLGTDNSPVYDYEDQVVYPEIVQLYEEIATIENSVLAEYTKEHLALLEENNWVLDYETVVKSVDLIETLPERFGFYDYALDNFFW